MQRLWRMHSCSAAHACKALLGTHLAVDRMVTYRPTNPSSMNT